ncbi:MAG: UDP-N-acetylmuramoyl-L-alanine--D-glutamate ligase [Candidatus Moranbacteria bacterium]|nr:UDP-N-acetylmuramoyl-L-alanine--D-glutamate ligase [Candidatus Moranbacteria bacterium]
MNTNYFRNKKITVFGLGLLGGGLGVVKFIAKHGAKKIIVTDIKSKEELRRSIEKLKGIKNIEFILGYHRIEDFSQVDMVIKNPQIPWDNKYIKEALNKKIPVEMDSSLFFKLCKNKIIGVTGTKGKTTTSSMIFDLLKNSGKNPIMVGVGQESVLDKLEKLRSDSIVVFELSSWRLSALGRSKLSPQIAVFKNIFPDHLNYYKGMKDYIADKENICKFQKPNDWCIVNRDDEIIQNISQRVKSQLVEFSFSRRDEGRSVFYEDERIYINDGIDIREVVNKDKLANFSKHNISNLLAAIGVALALGIEFDKVKKAVSKIHSISHRLEFVTEADGVKYYNDSAATIPDAAIAAIESFDKPVILIAGGSDKNLDFSDLAKLISEKVKGIIFLKGNATEKLIEKLIKNTPDREHKRFEIFDSMDKAVEEAARVADRGDVVLLSPGAASFGLFENEFDRGDKFKRAVKNLKK